MRPASCCTLVSGFFSLELTASSGQESFRRRKASIVIITSDHSGFAGLQPTAALPPPASIRSPENNTNKPVQLR